MSAAITALQVNGHVPSLPININEVAEYERILKLRDQIFAGTHPRLTVPAHAIRKVPQSSASLSHTGVPSPYTAILQPPQLPGLGLNHEDVVQDQTIPNVQDAIPPTTTASGIDPVLLTKSDDLVRAEIQLLRGRLEKALKEQFEQKRLDARKRPALGEGKPDFDVAAVLAKAFQVAKPETLLTPQEAESVSSFDENSLYSSKAPDSTPEAGELEDTTFSQNQSSFANGSGANGTAEVRTNFLRNAPPAAASQVPDPRTRGGRPSPPTNANHNTMDAEGDHDEDEDDDEEGEYSPPEAVEPFATPQEATSQPLDPRMRPLRRYSELDDGPRRPGSPTDGNIRIVRNHITSPVAPQPSHISPLAVAKDSIILQNTRTRNGRGFPRGRGEQSPEAVGSAMHPRKRRKLDKKDKRRRTGGASPDVKDEPVSPPPFHDVQPLGSGRLRPPASNEPILIDDTPPEVRYVRAPDRYVESPSRQSPRFVEPVMPMSEPRPMQRSTLRPTRDESDLRRVASLQSMRTEQPQYVQQYYDSPIRPRATSYIHADNAPRVQTPSLRQEDHIAYERQPSQVVRSARTPAPIYREVYQDAEPEVRYISQPPTPSPAVERIIVDAFGRQFREIIPQERPSVASRPVSTYIEGDRPVHYEAYDRPRAGSIMVEAGAEPRYVTDMPPPRIMRAAPEASSRRDMYEATPSARATSVVAIDRPARQPVYLDEGGDYQPSMRMGSVRPPPSRYEEHVPVPMLPRATSVRPAPREGSVFVDDRSGIRREYIQMEQPRYHMVEPEPRYIDAQGREVIMNDGHNARSRYLERY